MSAIYEHMKDSILERHILELEILRAERDYAATIGKRSTPLAGKHHATNAQRIAERVVL